MQFFVVPQSEVTITSVKNMLHHQETQCETTRTTRLTHGYASLTADKESTVETRMLHLNKKCYCLHQGTQITQNVTCASKPLFAPHWHVHLKSISLRL